MESVEEVAQQAALMVSQKPRVNPILSGPRLHRPTRRDISDENVTVDFGNNYDTGELNDFNVGVRIQRATIRGIEPLDDESETTAERDLSNYPTPITVQGWDGHHEKASALTRASDQIAWNKKGYV
jgi:hypothetical protein